MHVPRLYEGLVRTDSSGRTFLVDPLKGGGQKHTFLFKYEDGKILLDDDKPEQTRTSPSSESLCETALEPSPRQRLRLSTTLWSFFRARSRMTIRVMCPGSCEAATRLERNPARIPLRHKRTYEKICVARPAIQFVCGGRPSPTVGHLQGAESFMLRLR